MGKGRSDERLYIIRRNIELLQPSKRCIVKGVSIAAIARFLDIMKTPTQHQGKDWRYNMIVTVLKREEVYLTKNKPRRRE